MIQIKQLATVEELWLNRRKKTGNIIVDAMVEFLRATRSHQVEDLSIMYEVPKRLFQEAIPVFVGVSPSEMIGRWRALDAAKALLDTQLSEEKIAAHCGFQSVRNLRVVLKKYYGTTAMAVRKGAPVRNSVYAYNNDRSERQEIVENAAKLRAMLLTPEQG